MKGRFREKMIAAGRCGTCGSRHTTAYSGGRRREECRECEITQRCDRALAEGPFGASTTSTHHEYIDLLGYSCCQRASPIIPGSREDRVFCSLDSRDKMALLMNQ